MIKLSSDLIKTDVTAIKIINNNVLAGIGDSLFVFDHIEAKLVKKISVFEGCKIHGIEINSDSTILIHGGNNLCTIKCDYSYKTLEILHSKTVEDWVMTAKLLNHGNIAVVFMHNYVALYSNNLKKLKEVSCEEKCSLYSAFICNSTWEDLVVLSGTVFSEIVIWKPSKNNANESHVRVKLKGHQGVIFSLHYNEKAGYICSTSDDRSSILWTCLSLEQDVPITLKCRVYGHLSRVFRCKIMDNFFITAGEDSLLNIWDFNGLLLRTIKTHQGGSVWCIDCDSKSIVSGGGDSGITKFPLSSNLKDANNLALPKNEVPRQIRMVHEDLAVMTECGNLYYYSKGKWKLIAEHEDLKSYVLMEVSPCKKLVSLAGFHGEIYIYKKQSDTLDLFTSHVLIEKSRIYSLHWLSHETFITCGENGNLSLFLIKDQSCHLVTIFTLPQSKERWTTSACQADKGKYIFGDRKGNMYIYFIGSSDPIQILKKQHNHLGVTNMYCFGNTLVSLGRNSVIRTYVFDGNGKLVNTTSNKVQFSWLARISGDFLLAFSGKNFIIWNYKLKRVLAEFDCGGGHRSWDFFNDSQTFRFCFIKDKEIKMITFDWDTITPVDLVVGYHTKEINCLKVVPFSEKFLVVSGSEDTELRVSVINNTKFYNVLTLKSHLSSIRTLCILKLKLKNHFLIFTGGGRAQIICWKLNIEHSENIVCNEQFSYYEKLQCEESEMRIMHLEAVEMQHEVLLFAACSDGNIKMFTVNDKYELSLTKSLFHHIKCIMKVTHIRILESDILVSMSTDGSFEFWDLTNHQDETNIVPFASHQVHQSGVNSFSYKILDKTNVIFLSGGDDNCISLNRFKFERLANGIVTVGNTSRFEDKSTHHAQITGVFLDNKYIVTTSIDQNVAVFKWSIDKEMFNCDLMTKYKCSVADIQGMECFIDNGRFEVFLYGKGIEFIRKKSKDEGFRIQNMRFCLGS